MSNPLFSTYSQGENRVTSTIMAVFERLSFAIVEQILQSLLEEPETKMLSFQNQPSGPKSVPDARISASFSYWIETKITKNSIRSSQLKNHLAALDDPSYGSYSSQRLLVLTPDPIMPEALSAVADSRLVWSNFDNFGTAIQDAIQVNENWLYSDDPLPTESERDLLRELIQFLITEKLIGQSQEQVLIVAARLAYPEYRRYGLYFCQPNRFFQNSLYMGFYSNGQIQPEFPKIYNSIESLTFTQESINKNKQLTKEEKTILLTVLEDFKKVGNTRIGRTEKVIFLSKIDSEQTLKLKSPIENDLEADSGRKIGFTQGQRYVALNSLKQNPKTTTELLKLSNETPI